MRSSRIRPCNSRSASLLLSIVPLSFFTVVDGLHQLPSASGHLLCTAGQKPAFQEHPNPCLCNQSFQSIESFVAEDQNHRWKAFGPEVCENTLCATWLAHGGLASCPHVAHDHCITMPTCLALFFRVAQSFIMVPGCLLSRALHHHIYCVRPGQSLCV